MPEYTPQQKRVIAHKDGNLLVSAAAGSGKTAVLVERILELVRSGADIASFLIVTFTRAAADELRQRLLSRLETAAEEDETLLQQVERVELASISTIHAFCLQLIGRYFEKVGAEPGARTCTEAERIILQQRAMDAVLDEMYSDDERMALLEKMGSPDQVRFNAECLHRFLMCQPDPLGWLENSLAQYSAEKGQLRETAWFRHAASAEGADITWVLAHARAALRFCLCSFSEDCRAMEALIRSDCTEIELVIAGEKETPEFARWKSPVKRKDTPSADLESLQAQRTAYRELFKSTQSNKLNADEWEEEKHAAMEAPLYALADITRRFMKEYAALKRENGVMDYNDLEQLALQLTQEESVCEDLRSKYRYIFVDEYQDSSAVQEAILGRISRGDNVFHVGDVKQSIYGFRQSEPSLFLAELDAYAAQNGGQLISLNRNFRSLANVLHCTNRVFSRCMTRDSVGMDYDEDAALYPGRESKGPEPATIVQLIEKKPRQEEEDAEQVHSEIEAVARLVKSFIGTPVQEKDGTTRPARYGDIVVLRRAVQSVLPQYMEHFQRCGIPVFAGKGGNFYETPEIRQVMDYLWAVHNPLEDVHLLGALRGIGEFDAQELANIRLHARGRNGQGEHRRMWGCLTQYQLTGENAVLQEKVRAFTGQLNAMRRLAREESLSVLCSAVLEETGMLSRFAAMPKGRVRVANLHSLPVRAAEYDAAGLRLGDFLRRIASTAARNREEDVPAFSENDDVVRIMTVHQSKGLEFPIVIGAGLGANFRITNDKSSDGYVSSRIWCEKEHGLALEFYDPDAAASDATVKTRAIASIKKEAAIAEEMRILYVLMTRARERLALVGEVRELDKRMKDWSIGSIPAKCMLDWVMPALLTHPDARSIREKYGLDLTEEPDASRWDVRVTMEAEVQEEAPAESPALCDIEAASADSELLQQLQFVYPYPEPTVVQKASVSELAHGAQQTFFIRKKPAFLSREKKLTGAARGSAIHRFMEILDFEPLKNCSDRTAELTRQAQCAKDLARITPEEADAVLGGLDEIGRFLDSPVGCTILSGAKVLREKPFEIRMDEDGQMRLVQGVIDLIVLTEEGAILVDYKTDHTGLDEASVREKHSAQVALYRKAAQLAGLRVQKSLVYLFYTGNSVEIEA